MRLEVLDGIRAKGTGGIRVGAANVEDAVGLPGEERADEEITTVIRRGVGGGFPEREEGGWCLRFEHALVDHLGSRDLCL